MGKSIDNHMQKREPGPWVEDEEFAEKIYDLEAPVTPQFNERHSISSTGGLLRPGVPAGTDAAPPEEQIGV
jgi:hypothetical protein